VNQPQNSAEIARRDFAHFAGSVEGAAGCLSSEVEQSTFRTTRSDADRVECVQPVSADLFNVRLTPGMGGNVAFVARIAPEMLPNLYYHVCP
jgi:hypothetical protein